MAEAAQDCCTASELPLAQIGCSLDGEGAAAQGKRYATLGASLAGVEREELRLTARFEPGFDRALLEETVAVERSCCSFFSIDFEAADRRLTLSVPDAGHAPALDAIHDALTGS